MSLQKLFGLIILIIAIFISDCNRSDREITKDAIEQAEKIIAMEFTDAERDSMLDGLNDNLEKYHGIHSFALNNSAPPVFVFNPLPVGFKLRHEKSLFAPGEYKDIEKPAASEDLAYYSIGELATLLRTRQITSVELTKLYLERLRKYGPKLECVITLTEERALAMAGRADREIAAGKFRGLLHGIPYGIKDLFATKDYKTTWGAEPFKEQMITRDATVVKKLEDAGAVLVAKLTMGALAWGDVWFGGKTRNPWDMSQGSSGSSAGSAAAVSAGLVPFAIGTETWGSIVSPSTVCGVTGLRPTFGRVSRTGAMALSWTMDKIGPLCRNAEDCAIVFSVIYGPDGEDQSVLDFPFHYQSEIDLKKLTIGFLKSDFDADYPFKYNDSLAIEKMKQLGARLVPIELPDIPVNDLSIILSTEAAAAFDELTRSGKDDLLVRQIKNAWPNEFRTSRFIPAVEYVNANRIRSMLIQKMDSLMQEIDLYLAPSWQGDNLLLTNLSGHPCVVVPNGFSENRTPTSFCFVGKLMDEGKILAVAKAFQNATNFHSEQPQLGE